MPQTPSLGPEAPAKSRLPSYRLPASSLTSFGQLGGGKIYTTKAGIHEDLLIFDQPDLGVQN